MPGPSNEPKTPTPVNLLDMITSDIINSASKTATVNKKGTIVYKNKEEVFKEEHMIPLPKAKNMDEERKAAKVRIEIPKSSKNSENDIPYASKHESSGSKKSSRNKEIINTPSDKLKKSVNYHERQSRSRSKSSATEVFDEDDMHANSSGDSTSSSALPNSKKESKDSDDELTPGEVSSSKESRQSSALKLHTLKKKENNEIKSSPNRKASRESICSTQHYLHNENKVRSGKNLSKKVKNTSENKTCEDLTSEKHERGKKSLEETASLKSKKKNISSSHVEDSVSSSRDSSCSPRPHRSASKHTRGKEKKRRKERRSSRFREKSDTDYLQEPKGKKHKNKHKRADNSDTDDGKEIKSKSSKKSKHDKKSSDAELLKRKSKNEKKNKIKSEHRLRDKKQKKRNQTRSRSHSELTEVPSDKKEGKVKSESKSPSRSPSLEIIEHSRHKTPPAATNTSRSPSVKRKRELSPRKREQSPRKREQSPRKREQSPRKREQSPRKREQSPKKRESFQQERRKSKTFDEFGRDLSLKKPLEAAKSNHDKTQKLLEALKFSLQPADIPKPSPSKIRDKTWSRESLLPATSTYRPRTDSISFYPQRQETRTNSTGINENFTGALGSLDDVYSPGDESPLDDVWPTKRKISINKEAQPPIPKTLPNKPLDDLSTLVQKYSDSVPIKRMPFSNDGSDTVDSDDMVIDSEMSSKTSSPKEKSRVLSAEESLKSSTSEEKHKGLQTERPPKLSTCKESSSSASPPKTKPREVKTEGSPSSPLINTVTDLVIKMKQAETLNHEDSPSPKTPDFLAEAPSPVPSSIPSPFPSDVPSPTATPTNSTPEYLMTPPEVQEARRNERIKQQSELEKKHIKPRPALRKLSSGASNIQSVEDHKKSSVRKSSSSISSQAVGSTSKRSRRSSAKVPSKESESKNQKSLTKNLENDRERERRSRKISAAKIAEHSSRLPKSDSSSRPAKESDDNRRSSRISRDNNARPSDRGNRPGRKSSDNNTKQSNFVKKAVSPELTKDEAIIPLLDQSPPPPPPPPPRESVIIHDHHRQCDTITTGPAVANGRAPLVYVNNNPSRENKHSTSLPDFSNGSMVRKRARLDPPSGMSVTDFMGSHSAMFGCLNDSYAMEQFNDAWDKEAESPTAFTSGNYFFF